MHPSEVRFLADYLDEQTLVSPTQVETLIFSKPDRFVFLFFLDKTKQDLQIHIKHEEWSNLEQTLTILLKKYAALHLKPQELRNLLEHCKNYPGIYGINFVRNILLAYFAHDPRKKVSPFPHILNNSKPQDVAEMIFNLNVEQASSYFFMNEP